MIAEAVTMTAVAVVEIAVTIPAEETAVTIRTAEIAVTIAAAAASADRAEIPHHRRVA
jgi:hypothetical protein